MKKIIFSILLLLIIWQSGNAQTTGANYDLCYHRLEWKLNPAIVFIEGKITSYFHWTSEMPAQMTFDADNALSVDSVFYHGEKLNFLHQNDLVTIQLPDEVDSNQLDSVSVFYHGVPDNTGFGSFGQAWHNGIPIIWTLSEPYGAKDWWVCKQTLIDKIDSIDIFVETPKQFDVASNGLIQSEIIVDDKKTVHWKHKHRIANYLIAIAVTDYAKYSEWAHFADGDSVEILNYVYPEDSLNAIQKTKVTAQAMQLYNEIYMPYPFRDEKYGHAQCSFGGAMEHQTMSFMGNFNFITVVHELAHHWFGDFITCGSWHDIWLNEAFATYSEAIACEHGIGTISQLEWLNIKIQQVTQQHDGSVYVEDISTVPNIFDYRLTYAKSALVLHSLRWEIGDEAFFQAIKNYLNDPMLADNFATTDDLKAHFEAACECSLSGFFNDWIYGEGHPNYTVYWKQDEQNRMSVRIDQTPSHTSVDFFQMHVPIRFVGGTVDTLMAFDHQYTGQLFEFQLDGRVNRIDFDPERKLITPQPVIYRIDTFYNNNKILIAPNPATEKIVVITGIGSSFAWVELFDIHGHIVKSITCEQHQQKLEIDVTDIPAGIYILKIKENDQQIFVKKMVKAPQKR